ncbi:thioredoxin [Haloferax prahovense DSM 18310]|uniref:Thioredoxin n=1 Tax=Haloferax prahovense (strain DSM 18310 / JCM 13924 / TL6) TaxID=1227461 RepID=M0GDL7_HALPT|nr:thioredoxin family protein [Haloferax prahovense]ELZ68904.1 thioredoxin [Haloferax prahovense DSM 18310]
MTKVLLFTQKTCSACATQKEKTEGIEDEFPDVEFREVDIQRDLDIAEEYGVQKTPTTLIYSDGEQVAEFIGIVERDELEGTIRTVKNEQSSLTQRLVEFVRG